MTTAQADFSVKRRFISRLAVDARAGDDTLRISDAGGVFTYTIPTTLQGDSGDDTLIGGSGNETFLGGSGIDVIDGGRGADLAFLGCRGRHVPVGPGRRQRHGRGPGRQDTMVFNGATPAPSHRPVG